MARSLLIISYYWPPAGGPGVQRWLKFTTYLQQMGYDLNLIIPENPDYPVLDESLLSEIPRGLNIIEVPIFEPSRLLSSLSRKRTKNLQRGIIKKKQSLVERWVIWARGNLFVPDARVGWKHRVVKVAAEFIAKNPESTVITTGPPHSVHLNGLDLKRKFSQIKWLADFRDPWTTIGYHHKLRLGKSARQKHENLEQKVLNQADRVVVTSPHTQQEFEQKTTKPVAVVTNGYDIQPNENIQQPSGKFKLSHVGTLLSDRNPQVLWAVLSELCDENSSFCNDLELHLAGNVSEEILRSIESHLPSKVLKRHGYLNHEDAIELMYESQILLLIEINSEITKAIIPGKIFEYLASRRPIVALGPAGADIEQIIEYNHAGSYFSYQDHTELKAELFRLYNLYKSGNNSGNSIDFFREYHRSQTTQQLAAEIEKMWE
ncbi:glycosyl transferase family 1 [Nonlabens spongiae]|uniref:Glycosyl transferase family 1 n=1 Tax=Nonlabens spongiae TaxID=331648 RepID=A0A1W6MHJ4_9FLAO|nr:glycosyltransferase family 4 protein [Nonlabens spongiae]ARN77047.1 glycosyl transferase family 1 [Nonlabens spongiae]